MNIFVGDLSFDAVEDDLKKLFAGFGSVASVVIVMENQKKAAKSRGFGFVEMPDEREARAAIVALNGKEFMGRVINVNPTRPKTEAQRKNELKKKKLAKIKAKAELSSREIPAQNESRPGVFLNKPGTYKGGRRTRSFLKRIGQKEDR